MITDKKLQIQIVGECLNAVANGPFIPDWEFHTIFGLTREEVRAISVQWPIILEQTDLIRTAINNSINNLLGYPIDHPERWSEYISISKEKLRDIYSEWLHENYGDHGSYFKNLE